MNRLFVVSLLIVLLSGTSLGLYASFSEEGASSNIHAESYGYPSNIIDHLPFIINTTNIYFISRDLAVNGTGITILADNVILMGQGYTITGNGTESPDPLNNTGIFVKSRNCTVTGCNVRNFSIGIVTFPESSNPMWARIFCNSVLNTTGGICVFGRYNHIFHNIAANSSLAAIDVEDTYNSVTDNYADDAVCGGELNYFNGTEALGTSIIGGPCRGGNYWLAYAGEDSDGDGLGEISYGIQYSNYDYLPLVDIIPPHYSSVSVIRSFPPYTYTLDTEWKDNVHLDKAILELDGINYTELQEYGEDLGFNGYYQVEHSKSYSRPFTLSLGTHYYRWFANDTQGLWNSTELLSFNVTGIPEINSVNISPTLKVSANITCEGVGNITEIMEDVDVNFKIDDCWYMTPMTYDPATSLYTATLPAYNQLSNKTLDIYVAARDKNRNIVTSDVYIYHVPEWVVADIDRNGIINMLDLYMAAIRYGKP